ncbi:NAD(P)/FAD-dependent oxidoreductase [Cupriavidus necator]
MTVSAEPKHADIDVLIAGAGVVGLACAWAALKEGLTVTVVDRDFEGDRTSHGNAGGIAVTESTPLSAPGLLFKAAKWLMDPLGPLSLRVAHVPQALPWFLAFNKVSRPEHFRRISYALASLNNRVYDDFLPMIEDIGGSGSLYRRGAITVYETDKAYQADQHEWQFKRDLGVQWRELSKAELHDLEPGLAPVFERGVFLDQWSHIGDPKRLVTQLRERVRALGANFIQQPIASIDASKEHPQAVLANGTRLPATRIVVATGAWSEALAKSVGDRVLLDSERGYNSTLPHPNVQLSREIIFAERKFVATPLDIGLRIGGAAEFAGLNAPPNYKRSDALLSLAKRFLPGVNDAGAVRWMGHRPATPDSLPVIGASPRNPGVLYAFGHGHLGLTQSATTGALIADLLKRRTPRVNLQPFSISRFG